MSTVSSVSGSGTVGKHGGDSNTSASALQPADAGRDSDRALAAMLLAAIVSALVVTADAVVDTYSDGHLLLGWITLWAVGFASLALLGRPARDAAARLSGFLAGRATRRAQQLADGYVDALAHHDPRIMAELQAALVRADAARQFMDEASGRAWLGRHPVGTFSASYPGPRRVFRSTPLAGLPTHLQYLPS